LRESVAVKYGRIAELRQGHPAAAMCRVLDVAESGYHVWRKPPLSPRAQQNRRLKIEIKAAHERTRQTYSPEGVQADLADNGIPVGIYRIKRMRRKLGLRGKQKRKFKVTMDSNHALPVTANLLDRQFAVAAPNKSWVTDITDAATDGGWLCLAGFKDLCDGELVGYAMHTRISPIGKRCFGRWQPNGLRRD
jgi:putative transposase